MCKSAVIIASPGYSLRTGYYQRVRRDAAAIRECGLTVTVLEIRELLRTAGRFRLRRVWQWTRRLRSADLVVSENYGALLVHALMALPGGQRSQKHVFVAHGSLAELAAYRWGGLKRVLYKWLESVMVPRVDRLLCVSEVMARDFRRRYPVKASDIVWSPNNPDPTFYRAVENAKETGVAELRRELGLPGDATILLYVGNMQVWQNIDLLLDVARATGEDSGFHLVCLTGDPTALEEAVRRQGIGKTRYTIRSVPNREVPKYLVSADWLFAVRQQSEINRVSCPTKAVEYLLSGGNLVVSEELGDISELVSRQERGLVVSEELASDPKALAQHILDQRPRGGPIATVPAAYDAAYTASLFNTLKGDSG